MRVARRLAATMVALALASAPAWAGEAKAPDPDEVLKQLLGQAEAPERTPQQLAEAYALVVAKLAEGLATDDISQIAGPDRTLEELCHRAAAPGREPHRVALAKALLAELGEKSTPLGHIRLIRHIERIGRAEVVPALAARLGDKALREPARRALARNPAPEAAAALRATLPRADEPFRIGLIDALGDRRDAQSVTLLIAEASSPDEEVRTHAVEALAKIGDPAAEPAISAAMKKGPDRARRIAADAYLTLADALVATTDPASVKAALSMYRSLLRRPGPLRCAALVGLGKAGTAQEVDTLVEALGGTAAERGAATYALVCLGGRDTTATIAKKLAAADPALKTILLEVLGRRGDPDAVPAVLEAAKGQDEAVRLAAYEALGRIRSPAAIQPLVGALLGEKGELRDKAEWALSRIPGKEVTDALVQAWNSLQPQAVGPEMQAEDKAALLRSLGYRKDPDTLPLLITATRDPVEAVRAAAFRAIGPLNTVKAIPAIIQALEKEKGAAREAAAYALRRTHSEEATAAIVQAAKDAPPAALAPILRVLSWREHPAAKDFLVANAKSPEANVRAAALDGLARVEAPEAVPAIIEAATKGEDEVRMAAIRTSLQYADAIIQADEAAARQIFTQAIDRKVIKERRERNLALNALGKVGGPEVVGPICNVLRDRHVAGAAHGAVFRIAGRLAKAGEKDQAIEALLALARHSNDHGRIRHAQREMEKLGLQGEIPPQCGFITHWWVCGPFPNPKNALFNKPLPPEEAKSVDLAQPVQAEGVSRTWQPVHSNDPVGRVNLEGLLERREDGAALMYAEVTVPEAMDVYLKLGYDEGCVAYVNGKKVHSRSGARFRIDERRCPARLEAGRNAILLKIVNLGPGWAACARLTGRKGEPVPFTQKEAR